ncbi:MAG TPA: lactate racemase domain-containing protein [Deferrisomatales bacterium]|nr:lactate racemase domain-containing protein [Deferrisomatales bacterium]
MLIPWQPLRLTFPRPELRDPEQVLEDGLAAALEARPVHGRRVAVAVGSRGITGIARWVEVTVRTLRAAGAVVQVVPAMGSHGGGTAAAQARVLADLGVTGDRLGVPVVSREAVVRAGTTVDGTPVWCDAAAWEADLVVPINRVKPHTAFRGTVESGPSKLLAVGLGKGRSAAACHRAGLARSIPAVTRFWLDSGRVPCGVALVENAYHGVAELAVLTPPTWLDREANLLHRARALLPRLPWETLDLLVVREIGKDISGTGMDLNVVGLDRRFPGCDEPPRIRRVVCLALSPASHGNANGVGYADGVTEGLAAAVDWKVTRDNARTTGFAEAAVLPPVAADEEQAVAMALAGLPRGARAAVRAVRIRDTSHLTEIEVSPALASPRAAVHRTCE